MPSKSVNLAQTKIEIPSKKPFKLFDAVLACVCVILVVEAAAPSASIGNSKYFWWILSMFAFFIPYGLVTAELGTTYSGGGGLYDWISRAYGRKWGGRAAYYYWVHFALWMAALGVLFTEVIGQAFMPMGTWLSVIVQLIFIWVVGILSLLPISESKILINLCSVFKVAIMAALGVLGVVFAVNHGVANPVNNFQDLLPSISGISFIAMVMFNFKGFEVVTTFASEMKNPRKEIPKALFMAGVIIVAFYLFASFGMGVAIPREELSTYGGLLDSFTYFFVNMGLPGEILIPIIALMFLYSLLANPIVWALGVNDVAFKAAKDNAMPSVFAKESKKGAPLGATIASSLVASTLVLLSPIIPNPDIFWEFFALQILMLLLPYVIMFPAFKKLRRIDADTPRPYKVPGGKAVLNFITYSPMIMLLVSGILVAVYPNQDGTWTFEWLMIMGTVVSLAVGEAFVHISASKEKQSSKN